jgi:thiol-disulfide isomerase/thioredoxin
VERFATHGFFGSHDGADGRACDPNLRPLYGVDPDLPVVQGPAKAPFRDPVNKIRSLPLAAAVAILLAMPADADIRVGDPFPPLASAGLVGGALPATSGKVVLVDFWASWCPPCKLSFPAYARLNSEFAAKGLVIVAVSVDQSPGDYEAFVRKFAPQFHVALDRDQRLVRAAQVSTMPTCYLVDRLGRVRYVHPGFRGAETEQALRDEIGVLISEGPR